MGNKKKRFFAVELFPRKSSHLQSGSNVGGNKGGSIAIAAINVPPIQAIFPVISRQTWLRLEVKRQFQNSDLSETRIFPKVEPF